MLTDTKSKGNSKDLVGTINLKKSISVNNRKGSIQSASTLSSSFLWLTCNRCGTAKPGAGGCYKDQENLELEQNTDHSDNNKEEHKKIVHGDQN